ncbi:MAG: purine nucleoside permease [Burkholderiales bacterium]|jgi:purine nucleoside permease|nr:purine nucleoside permease [Burkholderiales bacterium]
MVEPTAAAPIKVKVFIATMFELDDGNGQGASEFRHWKKRYWQNTTPIAVRGAPHPVYGNRDGVCGAVLGIGKVRSAAAMQAILLDPRFDFSEAYFMISGAAGAPPSKATIGSVIWGTWLVDADLGHRWAPDESAAGELAFLPCQGFETTSVLRLNPALVSWAMRLSAELSTAAPLQRSKAVETYCLRYPDAAARGAPVVGAGTHVTSDCFFHGPGLSAQTQAIARLYGADDYTISEMEGIAVAQAIQPLHGLERVMSLRVAANFDQPPPSETTVQHLAVALAHTTDGLADSIDNLEKVGGRVVDTIVARWEVWRKEVPALSE